MIGRIYKVQHLDSDMCYIGSTCNTIRDRWRTHKSAFGQWVKNKDRVSTVALYPFLEQYGIDRFKMILIKEYQVADKVQIKAYEQLVISRTKLCCNRNAALQLISPKSLAKHYRQGISEQSKDYYQANRDTMIKRSKDRYQANKDAIINRVREYGATRIMCECGTESSKNGIYNHRKTTKHARLLAELNASQ